MKFLAKLQNMAASDIMNIIPSEIYHEIKEKDPTPIFKAYVIGHEGEATGKKVGGLKLVRNWFSSAIKKLVDKLQFGTKLFHGHNLDSSHEGRQPIGEIVGKALKDIKDKLSAVGIAYIYPEYRGLPLDVASIEADVNIDPLRDTVEAVDVKDITGIALGNSAIEKPGFANASLLSQIQAFANGQLDKGDNNMADLTIGKIIDFIRSEKVRPSELFKKAEIIDDPIVEEIVKEKNPNEYEARKRIEKEHEKEKEEWEKEKKELESKVKESQSESAKIKAVDLFSKKAKERELSEKQTKFIEKKKDSFIPENPEEIDKEVDKFMDSALEEYKTNAEIFGVKDEKDEPPKGGSEPGDNGSGDENELIPD